jgi:8-oxo-dGTP pyrophosphatase MutT (NUDIX family)
MTDSLSDIVKPKLYFVGANPTADMILMRPGPQGPEVLLIVRGEHSTACPLLPAFPGGFVDAIPECGERHVPIESPEAAGRRELLEETGLVAGVDVELSYLGAWQSSWRDPRNDVSRFAVSHLFCAWVPEGFGPNPQGLDDTQPGQTTWVRLSDLAGVVMAFDHGAMLSAACAKLGVEDPGANSWALRRHWERLLENKPEQASA